MKHKPQIKVLSPWFTRLETDVAVLSADIQSDAADALLCDWAPSPELFEFPRRKAWYCCEPRCQFNVMEGGSWPGIRDRLSPHERFCHNHPDEQFRIPHITHFETLSVRGAGNRRDRAVAIISNHGGSPWRRHPDVAYRNAFATHPLVDLYGRSGWQRYRPGRWSFPRRPLNYCGELPGDWPAAGKRDLMAGYKVAVCLENMAEPHYFTEKFVEAVCAGCIPVYRAEATVAATVLKGAAWIDPSDYGHSVKDTLQAALDADRESIAEQNRRWVNESRLLADTHYENVYRRIASLLISGGESQSG